MGRGLAAISGSLSATGSEQVFRHEALLYSGEQQFLAGVVCEVRDGGRLDDPLAGRRRPDFGEIGGHGLWIANQLCDLVQLRSFAHGSAVRIHMRTG